MKTTIRNMLLALVLLPFLTQCASQDEVNRLNYQLRVMNKKLADMKNDTVEEMQRRQAASSDQIDQLQAEIRNLKGQLEETAHMNQELMEQNKNLEGSFKTFSSKSEEERAAIIKQNQEQDKVKEAKLAELSQKLAALQAIKLKEAERREREASHKAEESKLRANEANKNLKSEQANNRIVADKKKVVKEHVAATQENVEPSAQPTPHPKTAVKTAEPAPPAASANDTYSQAMAEYNKGNYAAAFKQFESYVGKNSTGEKSIEARYMMGECLFKQKEYDQSILQYQKIVSNYPQNPKTPAALLRQGMAFESLSDKDTARIIYKKIIMNYGNSSEAATAKQRMGNL